MLARACRRRASRTFGPPTPPSSNTSRRTGSRLTDLAERAQITKQSMGNLVDYLEQRGYVERRPDPTDRRAALICLTGRGWDQIRAALSIIATIEHDWARRIGKRRI